jgi:hypothetical protein
MGITREHLSHASREIKEWIIDRANFVYFLLLKRSKYANALG